MSAPRASLVLAILAVLCGCYSETVEQEDALPNAGSDLSLVSWNLGYAGLGEGSDFFKDLGSNTRPPSAEAVDGNIAGIRQALASMPAAIYLFQEMARPSYVNYRRDLLGQISAALPEHAQTYVGDFATSLVPPPFSISIGNASFVGVAAQVDRFVLEGQIERYFLVASRVYSVHIIRLSGPVPWTVLNIHLSAFDAENEGRREIQAREVIALAEAEYRAGRCVVIGGDWNMRLRETGFPHATEDRFLFWIRDLVPDLLPSDWTWAVDTTFPYRAHAAQTLCRRRKLYDDHRWLGSFAERAGSGGPHEGPRIRSFGPQPDHAARPV